MGAEILAPGLSSYRRARKQILFYDHWEEWSKRPDPLHRAPAYRDLRELLSSPRPEENIATRWPVLVGHALDDRTARATPRLHVTPQGARSGRNAATGGGGGRIAAIAPHDPFAPRTFSGYSEHLFSHFVAEGIEVVPFATNDLRWYDVLSGAVNPVAVARRRLLVHSAPGIRQRWLWSRRGFARLSRRVNRELGSVEGLESALQVGTQTAVRIRDVPAYCVIDCTIVQAIGAGHFGVSLLPPPVAREAVENQKEVFHSCRKVFVLSEWTARSVIRDYGYPESQTVVVGAGANLWQRLPRRPDPANPSILFVGRDWERKGGPLLLEAFRLVQREQPRARLQVVGCTPSTSEPGVEIIGELDRTRPEHLQRLLELYAAATCFSILPVFDPFPNVLLEAAYCGVPIVSTAEGSRGEVVLHERTGLLVDKRDPDAVAEALLAIMRGGAEVSKMAENAAALVDKRFTWPNVARHVLDEMGMAVSR